MEYQAVVMAAGKGSRLSDLTSQSTKALLPIANRPMIWYPINMLEKAGFTEVIVVVSEAEQQQIGNALLGLEVRIDCDYVTIPDDEDMGTADSLRLLKPKIKRDLLIVSCDLLTDLSLHLLADVHRTNDATVTMLLAPALDTTEISVPGGKANKKIEKELIGVDERGSRVMFISSEADLDETVTFKKSFFKKFPYVNMKTRLVDAHMYLMKKSVLDILDQNSSISTVRGELIPHLVKKQFQAKKPSAEPEHTDINALDQHSGSQADAIMESALEMSTWSTEESAEEIKCYCYTAQGGFCLRANSLIAYCEANRQVPRQLQSLTKEKEVCLVHQEARISPKTQTGGDSMIGEQSEIGEKCGVKRSVIGKHCTISDKVKIANSVVMNGVSIKEGCQITGCVISDSAQLDERCELKDCIVGASQHIKAGAKFSNEALVVDRMMEI